MNVGGNPRSSRVRGKANTGLYKEKKKLEFMTHCLTRRGRSRRWRVPGPRQKKEDNSLGRMSYGVIGEDLGLLQSNRECDGGLGELAEQNAAV